MNCHWIVTPRGRGPGVYSTHAVIEFLRVKKIQPQDTIRDEDTNAVWVAELWEKVFSTPAPPEQLWHLTPCGGEAGVYSTQEVIGFLRAKLIQPQDEIRDNATNAAWMADLWSKVYSPTTHTQTPLPPTLPPTPAPARSDWNAPRPAFPATPHTDKSHRIVATSKTVASPDADENPPAVHTKDNPYGRVGFFLGIASVFLAFLGIIPLTGLVLSCVGLATHDDAKHRNKWQAVWGVGLNAVFLFVNASIYGHI